jgi:hypothetical protein
MMDFTKNDLSKARKGDQLWDFWEDKWVVVEKVDLTDNYYPIELANGITCTKQGLMWTQDRAPRYFWNEIHFDIPERPKRIVKKPVEFWSCFQPGLTLPIGITSEPKIANNWALKGLIVRYYTDEIEIEE